MAIVVVVVEAQGRLRYSAAILLSFDLAHLCLLLEQLRLHGCPLAGDAAVKVRQTRLGCRRLSPSRVPLPPLAPPG